MAKAKKDGAGKPRGRKQEEIPGTQRERIDAIDQLALEYRDARNERMELQEQEESLLERLDHACAEHGVGQDAEHPYVFLDDEHEPFECFREATETRMRVRKQKKPKVPKTVSSGGGPGAREDAPAPAAVGDDFGETGPGSREVH